jgi:glutamyl-tRNA reductase
VPRDIEPSVRNLCSGITLFDMDDLQAEVDRSISVLEGEADKARSLVDEEAERFEGWLDTLEVVPTISALRELGERIVEQVLSENESRWESLSDADRERLGVMARAVVNRLLHEPTLRLKAAAGEDAFIQLSAVRELFGLEAAPPGELPDADVADLDSRRRQRRR